MANINFNVEDQLNALAVKIADLEVENTRLSAIVQAAGSKIDELEVENQKLKDEQVRNVKVDKKEGEKR